MIKETYGVPVEEIQRGHQNGVRKVNIDTDIRLAMTGAMRRRWPRSRASSIRAGSSRRRAKPTRELCRDALRGVRLRRQASQDQADRRSRRWPSATGRPRATGVALTGALGFAERASPPKQLALTGRPGGPARGIGKLIARL